MKPFSDLTGKEKAIEFVRWLLVPAAAVLAVAILITVARLATPPVYAQPPGTPPVLPSDFHRFILPRIFGILMAGAFVIAGAKTAPRFHPTTAVVLAVLWTLYAFLIHVLVHLGQGKPHYLDFALSILAAVSATALIFYAEKSTAEHGHSTPGS